MLFKSSIPLLISYLVILSITKSGVLRSTLIVELFLLSFLLIFYIICSEALLSGVDMPTAVTDKLFTIIVSATKEHWI